MASDTSVIVSWDHVDLQVSGYIVYHTQTNNSTERSFRVSDSTHSALIQNLAYDKIYTFQVAVFVEFDGGELISQKSSITDTTILRTTRLGMYFSDTFEVAHLFPTLLLLTQSFPHPSVDPLFLSSFPLASISFSFPSLLPSLSPSNPSLPIPYSLHLHDICTATTITTKSFQMCDIYIRHLLFVYNTRCGYEDKF